MRTSACLLCFASVAAAFTGCTRSVAGPRTNAREPTPAAIYKAGHGIQVSAVAAQMLRLELGEVAPRDFAGTTDALAIPAAALLRTVRGDFVFVANGEWLLRTPVTIGHAEAGFVAISEGLYEGDRIVTHGARALWLAELQAVNGGVACADHH